MATGVNITQDSIPKSLEQKLPTLQDALQDLGGDPPSAIPFWVWLLENPDSPIAMPGKIDLYGHDCLHVLLGRGFSAYDEAFVVGFTMGNDNQTSWLHVAIFKWFSAWIYPEPYRLQADHFKTFELGFAYGRSVKVKNLNRFDFQPHEHQSIAQLRLDLGIDAESLALLQQTDRVATSASTTSISSRYPDTNAKAIDYDYHNASPKASPHDIPSLNLTVSL